MTDLTISHGDTNNTGGGIYNISTLTVTNCTLTNDSAGEEGGGLDNEDNLTVVNCTFTNDTSNYGGGLFNDSTLTMSDTTISDNSLSGTGGGGAGFGNEGTATLTDCTITDNLATGSGEVGGGVVNYYVVNITGGTITGNSATVSGGGIDDQGTALSVTNCTISQNTSANGGGVFGAATTTITFCQITGNISTATGGGISDAAESTMTVSMTTISGNSATTQGGGIFNLGTLTVTNSSLIDNTAAGSGGGIAHLGGFTTVIDSTLSANSASGAGLGGGIAVLSPGVSVLYSTLSGNSATNSGGGIYLSSPFLLVDTIIANSPSGGDLAGGSVGEGSVNNLIDDAATGSGLTNGVGGNIINHPASLGALGNNGGPTQTFGLLPGSLAENAGTPVTLATLGQMALSTDTTLTIAEGATIGVGLYIRIDAEILLITAMPTPTTLTVMRGQLGTTAAPHANEAPITLATDQRGVLRSVLTPDIGAVEMAAPLPSLITLTGTPGNDQFVIQMEAGNDTTLQYSINGGDTFTNVAAASVSGVNVTGMGGNDTLTLNLANGLLTGSTSLLPLTFTGGVGSDQLIVVGNPGGTVNETFTASPATSGNGTLVLANATASVTVALAAVTGIVDTSPIASLTINADDQSNAILIGRRAHGQRHRHQHGARPRSQRTGLARPDRGDQRQQQQRPNSGGNGEDENDLTGQAFMSLTFANKTGVTINGVAGDDLFILATTTPAAGLQTLGLNGGTGFSVLSAVAPLTGVTTSLVNIGATRHDSG